MSDPRPGEATWKFAIMFQIGMLVIGLFLVVVTVVFGRVLIAGAFGALLIVLAIAGIWYSRKNLRGIRR